MPCSWNKPNPKRQPCSALLWGPLPWSVVSCQARWLERECGSHGYQRSQALWEPLEAGFIGRPQGHPSRASGNEEIVGDEAGGVIELEAGRDLQAEGPSEVGTGQGHCRRSRVSGGEGSAEKRPAGPAWRSEASNATLRNAGRKDTQVEMEFIGGLRRTSRSAGGGNAGRGWGARESQEREEVGDGKGEKSRAAGVWQLPWACVRDSLTQGAQ